VLFLDEPTIGLDVTMQQTVRDFIKAYNERFGATVLLTSHYMEDVLALCPRVIVIDHGHIIFDGELAQLVRQTLPQKRLRLRLSRPTEDGELARLGRIVSREDLEIVAQVPQADLQAAVAHAAALPMADLTVEDPPLEEVLSDLFARSRRERQA
jgi:ABC-2 type transport system ATP-binding protein